MKLLDKFLCAECGHGCLDGQQLVAPNPFDPEDDILGCPRCLAVNTLEYACDYADCWQQQTCGLPTPAGYRRCCSQHLAFYAPPLDGTAE